MYGKVFDIKAITGTANEFIGHFAIKNTGALLEMITKKSLENTVAYDVRAILNNSNFLMIPSKIIITGSVPTSFPVVASENPTMHLRSDSNLSFVRKK